MNRRTALCGLAVAALLAGAPWVWAQDPQSATVQRVARAWLAVADKVDADASWKAGGKKFQESLPMAQWTEAMDKVRKPIGDVVQRTMTSTTFDTSFPGSGPGTYAHVEFRTAFTNKTNSGETISLERESDGEWRVIGYSIH